MEMSGITDRRDYFRSQGVNRINPRGPILNRSDLIYNQRPEQAGYEAQGSWHPKTVEELAYADVIAGGYHHC